MKILKILCLVFMISLCVSFASAQACDAYTYTGATDSTDYNGVTLGVANTTVMTADQLFGAYTFLTPTVNFTVYVNETIAGGNPNDKSTLDWYLWNNISSSLSIKNGTDTIGVGNYSLYPISPATGRWGINWSSSEYNTSSSTLYAYFNRTFVKNTDDFIASPGTIYSGTTTSWFLSQNTPTAYGDDKTFTLGSVYGEYLSGRNFAVGWTYTERTCVAATIDVAGGITGIQTTVFAAFGLFALIIIITVAFAIVTIIQNGGNVDLTVLVIMAIGGAIILFVGYIIIARVAQSLIIAI